MSLQINRANVNAAMMQESSKVKDEKQVQKEVKPQAKEHCSSKASKALRGMALGMMLVAGVASAGKVSTVKAAENKSANNQTTVTQQAETNVPKTDVEMAVDELMENEGTQMTFMVGSECDCYGSMCSSEIFENGRNYDFAKISNGGVLVFYATDTIDSVSDDDDEDVTVTMVNAFDLQAKPNGSTIDLKSGSRFEEAVKMNGDYIELAEDGTFNVYNSEGEKIGHVKCDTPSSYKTKLALVAGQVVAAGAYAAIKKKNSPFKN